MSDGGDASTIDRLRAATAERLGVDRRALAAFRFALGTLLLVDLGLRARNLTAFYTDAGVLPRSALAEAYPLAARVSLHAVSGEEWALALLFVLAGVAAAALAVGYRTRIAAAASLALLISLQARNPFVLNGGDLLLSHLLGIGVLCPLGARWSVDAVRARAVGGRAGGAGADVAARDRFFGPASALLLAVPIVVYVSNAVVKLRGGAWTSGEAVGRVFRLTYLHGPLGGLVPEVPRLFAAATYGWLALLVAAPLLVLAAGRLRAALAVIFAAGHLAMPLVLQIGVFPLVSVAGLLPFVPLTVWDRAERRVAPVAARFGQTLGSPRTTREPSGWIPDCVVAAGRRLAPSVAAVLIAGLLCWNAMAVGVVSTPEPVAAVSDPTESGWDMFAPDPPTTDTRVLATAAAANGDRIDALYGDPVAADRPPSDARAYPTARWRKFLTSLAESPEPTRTGHLLGHLCDRASGQTDAEIDRVSVSIASIAVAGDDQPQLRSLGERRCGDR
ncbi:HTTM domain-containing protein [Halorubrum laminariae]|uniref:HTTM domain-containing protein n=1 Tax=Halorubrum laminariae TaxID=1433523 RepID=A0ABD6BWI5_9EURY|nr:HTTM domain-containing protein [Halorubrum laminariae]